MTEKQYDFKVDGDKVSVEVDEEDMSSLFQDADGNDIEVPIKLTFPEVMAILEAFKQLGEFLVLSDYDVEEFLEVGMHINGRLQAGLQEHLDTPVKA